jgi:hypothetical protein
MMSRKRIMDSFNINIGRHGICQYSATSGTSRVTGVTRVTGSLLGLLGWVWLSHIQYRSKVAPKKSPRARKTYITTPSRPGGLHPLNETLPHPLVLGGLLGVKARGATHETRGAFTPPITTPLGLMLDNAMRPPLSLIGP